MAEGRQNGLPVPPELLDAIFGCLHPAARWDDGSNKADLLSCTLVNREWRALARPHLFCALRFRFSRVENAENMRQYQGSPCYQGFSPSLTAFYNFLAASPSICAWIRTLNLRLRLPSTKLVGTLSSVDDYTFEPVDSDLFYSLLSLFPHIQHIILAGIQLTEPVPHPRSPLISLDTLQISGLDRQPMWAPCAYNVSAVIDTFESVRSLHISVPLNAPVGRPAVSSTCKIASIIHESWGVHAFNTLIRCVEGQNLTSLQLPSDCARRHDDPSCLPIEEFLGGEIGDQILHLGVQLRAESGDCSPCSPMFSLLTYRCVQI